MRIRFLFVLAVLCLPGLFVAGQQKAKWPPSPHIASTEPLRPEEEVKKLKLPPGFELQLVAADPDIRKPININFDAAGRLWVTETIEYPFPAPEGKGRDAVKILEDFGPDGRARKITTFVDKLNIPIGVLPTSRGALVYTIPSTFHMIDTKGSGTADRRDVVLSGFGHKDTHGMTGEFQRGFDGWIYACHGFSNTSEVHGKGDASILMTSGNTYRFKEDGSQVESFTHGQVNPFGLAFDPFGNLYSGDCHSRPLTMLLRHGWYESFSRPHDGLGFAPHMNTFDGHSTALCGVAYYAANQYPKEYQGMLFLGDVVLNRINAYRLDWSGSSPKAVMQEFVTSKDPWFRPVDIKLGPDGCLYFADFYNRIIGHYEVPLTHPGRDREKGRIWRIVYRGKDGQGQPQPVKNFRTANEKELLEALAHSNLTVRLQATEQLAERGGEEVIGAAKTLLAAVADAGEAPRKAHALWVLERLGKLEDPLLARGVSAKEKEVRVHVQRILTEKARWNPKYSAMAKLGLLDPDPLVRRVALEALGAHPAADHVKPILEARYAASATDTHLVYAARLALRDQLRPEETWTKLDQGGWSEKDWRAVADVCPGVHNKNSAEFLKAFLMRFEEKHEKIREDVQYIVRNGSPGSMKWALEYAQQKHRGSLSIQGMVLKAAVQASQERGLKLTEDERQFGQTIVASLLQAPDAADQQMGAELTGLLRLVQMQPQLFAIVTRKGAPESLRKTCVVTLVNLDARQALPSLTQLLLNDKEAIAVREQIAKALASSTQPEAYAVLVKALQDAPARLQTVIALGMCATGPGGDRLLQAIEKGNASPRLLQDRAIEVRLRQTKVPNIESRLANLTRGLPAADQKSQQLISMRRDAFVSSKADPEAGLKVFQKHCAACHQIAGQGAKIGPQLDGIGSRGLERLLEDVLDPNRNVDQAFRTTVVTLKNGKVESGLFLRDDGNIVVLADSQGKEVRIEKGQIDERLISPLSPMPSNFAEQVSEPEFQQLVAYLLNQRSKQ